MNDKIEKEMIINEDSVSLDSYEKMAEYYFEYVDTKPFNAYYERPATVSLLPDVKGKTVLDAGCAAGWYTKYLLEKGASVTSIDFSPKMIEITKKRVGNKANVIRADLNEPLDFIKDESIDIVLSSLALHYVKNWVFVMNEFNRILKKSGQLIFSVHHPFTDFIEFNRENYFLTELLNDEWETNNGKVKVQFYTRPLNEVITPVIDGGFTIEKLLEPMPTEQFKMEQPKIYDRLTKRPQFLFIRAKKSID
ncbi:methylase involved in ubiquinone/menaquinone biosynthesis [Gottschalkia purinilytica]|uniref:Methylase involved in ubiquinone/menaquinone biosynthesis n=1 Tax=Gottschalkia purinilytica TaxID=1503 RepID=A0A0L0WCA2_GOTPU|nr:class I SAM-dependent methyltransferase [Gottschalkia purinilytica]KNF09035.1 methylase involved in ubiquinone/menaquinone biosynthesis [Gottschalkia purinilytica]